MTSVSELRKTTKKTPMKEIMKQPPKQRIATLLQENKKEIMAALPKHINIERMLVIAQTAATSVPQLLECYTPSLFGAMIKCTQLGLEPNNALGQAYLVPFRNNKQNRTDVQLIIGYRGLIDLARRSGNVISINSQAVREGDEFEYEFGLEERLAHRPGKVRGEITYFYAYAKLTGGGHYFDVRTREDMDALMRTTYKQGNSGPWKDHYERMGMKSMVRRIAAYLPTSINLSEAAQLDSRAEAGMDQGLETVMASDYTVVPEGDAPEALPPPAAAPKSEPEPIVDINGEIFDPAKHAVLDGEPVYNKDKSFRKKRGATKPAAAATSAAQESEPEPEQEEEQPSEGESEDEGQFYTGDDDESFALE